jgi:hypothetical protein
MWPPGPYAIPMSKYGCPESQSRGWFKSFLKVNMVVLSSSSDSSSTLYGRESERKSLFEDDDFFKPPFKTEDLKLYFCVKYRNETKLDQGQWISGNYSIYKIGQSCPLGIFLSNICYMSWMNFSYAVASPKEKCTLVDLSIKVCRHFLKYML